MAVSSAAVILAPIIRANEIVCIGPFGGSSDVKRSTAERSTYRTYKKVAWFLICYVIVRKMGLFAYKSKYAKHLIESDTDLIRAPMIFVMIFYSARKVGNFIKAFEMYDRFPHDELSNARLTRFVHALNVCQWVYSFGRVFLDLAAFFDGNNLPQYIRSELLLNPDELNTGFHVLAALYAVFNISLQRLVTSAPLTVIVLTYISINLLTEIKFRNLEESFAACLEKEHFSLSQFSRLRLMHADLCQLVLYLDEFLSPLAIYFHGGVVIGACLFTGRFVRRYKSGALATASLFETASFVINIIYLVSMLSFVSAITAMVCQAPQRLTKLLNDLIGDRGTRNMECESQQIRMLLSQMNVEDVKMTAWRFYQLDRGALIKTLGTVVTYVSLVVEAA